jgi:hypothetical protein
MTLRILITVLASFFVLGGGGYAGYSYMTRPKPQTYIVCPSDIRQCKDGITVGRISPSCEFAVCPEDRPAGSGGITVLASKSLVGVGSATLEDVRGNGGDYRCQATSTDEVSGEIFTSQGELRLDLSPVKRPNVRAVATHLLLGKQTTYAWSDLPDSGVSFTRGAEVGVDELKRVLPIDHTLPLALECQSWIRESEVLLPPSEVVFKDKTPAVATTTVSE